MSRLPALDQGQLRRRVDAKLRSAGIEPFKPQPKIGAGENFANAFERALFVEPRIAFNELTDDREEAKRVAAEADRDLPTREGFSATAGSVLGSLAPVAAAIGVAAATGGASAPASAAVIGKVATGAVIGSQAATAGGLSLHQINNFEEQTGKKVGNTRKYASAVGNAVIVGLASKIGADKLIGLGRTAAPKLGGAILSRSAAIQGGKGITRQQLAAEFRRSIPAFAARGASIEAIEEMAEQLGQNAIDIAIGTRTRSLFQDVPQSALAGAMGGGILGPFAAGASTSFGHGDTSADAVREAESLTLQQAGFNPEQAETALESRGGLDKIGETEGLRPAVETDVPLAPGTGRTTAFGPAREPVAEVGTRVTPATERETAFGPRPEVDAFRPLQRPARRLEQQVEGRQEELDLLVQEQQADAESQIQEPEVIPAQEVEERPTLTDEQVREVRGRVLAEQRAEADFESDTSEGPVSIERPAFRFPPPPDILTPEQSTQLQERQARVKQEADRRQRVREQAEARLARDVPPTLAQEEVDRGVDLETAEPTPAELEAIERGDEPAAVSPKASKLAEVLTSAKKQQATGRPMPSSVADRVAESFAKAAEAGEVTDADLADFRGVLDQSPAARERAVAAVSAKSLGKLIRPPKRSERGFVDVSGAVNAVESAIKTGKDVAAAGSKYLVATGKAFKSASQAAKELVAKFGAAIRKHVPRIFKKFQDFVDKQNRRAIGAVGDVGKARKISKEKIAKAKAAQPTPSQQKHIDQAAADSKQVEESRAAVAERATISGKPLKATKKAPKVAWSPKEQKSMDTWMTRVHHSAIELLNPFTVTTSTFGRNSPEQKILHDDVKDTTQNAKEYANDIGEKFLELTGLKVGTKAFKEAGVGTSGVTGFFEAAASQLTGKKKAWGAPKAKTTTYRGANKHFAMTDMEAGMLAAAIKHKATRELVIKNGITLKRVKGLKGLQNEDVEITETLLKEFEGKLNARQMKIKNATLAIFNGKMREDLIAKVESDIERYGALALSPDKDVSRAAKAELKRSEELLSEINRIPKGEYVPRAVLSDYKIDHVGINSIAKAAGMESSRQLKERDSTHKKTILIDDAFSVVARHSYSTSMFIHADEAVSRAQNLIKKLERDLTKAHGPHVPRYFNDMYQTIVDYATGRNTFMSDGMATQFMARTMRNLTIGILGANPGVALKQPVSIIAAATEIEGKYLRKALTMGSMWDQKVTEEVIAASPKLKARLGSDMSRVINSSTVGAATTLQRNQFVEGVMMPIGMMDAAAIRTIWVATKLEAEAKGVKHVAKRAEEIVDLTQPSFDIMDMSGLQREARKNPWYKMAIMFSNQRFQNLNIMYRAVAEARRGEISRKEATKRMVAMTVLSPLVLIATEELMRQALGDGAEDEEELAKTIERDFYRFNIGNLPFAGSLYQKLVDNLERPGTDSKFSKNPIVSTTDDLAQAIGRLNNENKDDDGRGWSLLINNAMEFAGIPTKPQRMLMQIERNLQ